MRDGPGRGNYGGPVAPTLFSIPLVDLPANFRSIEGEVRAAVERVLTSGQYIGGGEVEAFERAYAAFTGARHCVGVANGTDAIELMVRALGLGAEDAVLVPANSFVASALGVQRAGARVKLVDCTEDSLLDVASCAARLDGTVKAVLPVHLFGQCAPMEAVQALASAHRLAVLEDAAQSQGASRHGRRAGTFGLMAATSFYPGKNLGAYGDAGAVTTGDEALATKLRALRNYGSEVKYLHPELGFNSRLDALQAAILSVKLPHLADWNARRAVAASRYDRLLARLPDVRPPVTLAGNVHAWHLYTVRVPAAVRERVLQALHAQGVGAAVHYPTPIHLQGAFRSLGHRPGDFPVAEALAGQLLSLPLYPELTEVQQERVVQALEKAMAAS
jgi:dTDP-4-amino-4,6-dideoxygalactose transaminase